MKLTIDIGNTQIKIGVFDKFQLINSLCFDNSQNINQQFESIKKHYSLYHYNRGQAGSTDDGDYGCIYYETDNPDNPIPGDAANSVVIL